MLRSQAVAAAMLSMGVLGVALPGCSGPSASSSSLPPKQVPQFKTAPPGADVKTTDGQTCKTPRSLAIPLTPLADESVNFAMNGYTPQTVSLALRQANDFSPPLFTPNPVTVTLEAVPKPKAHETRARPKVAAKPVAAAPAPSPIPTAAPSPAAIPAAAPAPAQENAPPSPSPVESRFWIPPPARPPQ